MNRCIVRQAYALAGLRRLQCDIKNRAVLARCDSAVDGTVHNRLDVRQVDRASLNHRGSHCADERCRRPARSTFGDVMLGHTRPGREQCGFRDLSRVLLDRANDSPDDLLGGRRPAMQSVLVQCVRYQQGVDAIQPGHRTSQDRRDEIFISDGERGLHRITGRDGICARS